MGSNLENLAVRVEWAMGVAMGARPGTTSSARSIRLSPGLLASVADAPAADEDAPGDDDRTTCRARLART